ncbi:F0F1 ATP synthase subunit A [Brachybacterium sp. Z12]|uniref:F0F1 ATP synthase subunit A n=1 Tax=Brachybacterium sp. Z12 TaxID=2759167 RepID=UPI00223AE070|nr:FoF1 ATP synthase subunit a [Brachybacterium sp. Z12]
MTIQAVPDGRTNLGDRAEHRRPQSRTLCRGLLLPYPHAGEFFPEALLFEGTWFEFNRVQLVRLIVLAVVLIAMCIIASRAKLVPGRVQSVIELVIDFVNNNIIANTLGLKDGKRFAPMLITMFFFILSMNLAGVIPGLNLAGTSVIGLPLLLALWTFVTYVGAGIKKHGFLGYLKSETMPPGSRGRSTSC